MVDRSLIPPLEHGPLPPDDAPDPPALQLPSREKVFEYCKRVARAAGLVPYRVELHSGERTIVFASSNRDIRAWADRHDIELSYRDEIVEVFEHEFVPTDEESLAARIWRFGPGVITPKQPAPEVVPENRLKRRSHRARTDAERDRAIMRRYHPRPDLSTRAGRARAARKDAEVAAWRAAGLAAGTLIFDEVTRHYVLVRPNDPRVAPAEPPKRVPADVRLIAEGPPKPPCLTEVLMSMLQRDGVIGVLALEIAPVPGFDAPDKRTVNEKSELFARAFGLTTFVFNTAGSGTVRIFAKSQEAFDNWLTENESNVDYTDGERGHWEGDDWISEGGDEDETIPGSAPDEQALAQIQAEIQAHAQADGPITCKVNFSGERINLPSVQATPGRYTATAGSKDHPAAATSASGEGGRQAAAPGRARHSPETAPQARARNAPEPVPTPHRSPIDPSAPKTLPVVDWRQMPEESKHPVGTAIWTAAANRRAAGLTGRKVFDWLAKAMDMTEAEVMDVITARRPMTRAFYHRITAAMPELLIPEPAADHDE